MSDQLSTVISQLVGYYLWTPDHPCYNGHILADEPPMVCDRCGAWLVYHPNGKWSDHTESAEIAVTDGGVVAPLTVPDHIPRSLGEYELVERSEEQTVWRRTWTAIAGEYKTEILVFQQYGGWRVKRHYNQNMKKGRPGGYRYVDKSEERATFDDRREAELRAVEVLKERVDALEENLSDDSSGNGREVGAATEQEGLIDG